MTIQCWWWMDDCMSGRILTGENRSTEIKTCPSTTFSMTNFTWTNLGLNLGLNGDGSSISCLNCGMALMIDNKFQSAVQN